jgi:hypothetical protein
MIPDSRVFRRSMRVMLFFLVLVVFSGCQQPNDAKSEPDEPTFRKPSATEIFDLRSRCADAAKKIMSDNTIGAALAQDQVSHYDPKSNRCYVELTVHIADLAHFDDHLSRYLFDGQTEEILAWTKTDLGVKTGWTTGFGTSNFDSATTKIDGLMADDRKQ